MPGISIVVGKEYSEDMLEQALDDLQSDTVSKYEVLFRDPNVIIIFSGYDSYPRIYHETEEFVYCFEGMIYNISSEDLANELQSISQCLVQGAVDEKISDFVHDMDGDFLCIVYAKSSSKLVVFNDRLARLSAFYSDDENLFVMSREMRFILHFLPAVILDRMNIAQFLMFEYSLGDRTFFKSVHRFMESHMGLLSFSIGDMGGMVKSTIKQSCSISFDRLDKEVSREDCLEQVLTHFLTAVKRRADACSARGFELIADISGGYDTRAVVVGLEKLGIDVEYYTHCLVSGDESAIAKDLASIYGKHVNVVNVNHDLSMQEFSQMVYLSDCQVNGWTAGTAWKDSLGKKKTFLEGRSVANFMGFAGEALRHPFPIPPGYTSLTSMVKAGILATTIRDDRVSELLGIPLHDIHQDLITYFQTYPETTFEGRLKHYCFEFFHHQGIAGEDRTRRLFWTVQPFGSHILYMYEMNKVPLSFANYSMFSDFLRAMDERALTVPIYGSNIDPTKKRSFRILDFMIGIRYRLRNAIISRPLLKKLLLKYKQRKRDTLFFNTFGQQALSVHRKLTNTRDIMTEKKLKEFYLQEYNPLNAYRLLSLLMYLERLESMYGDKVQIG